MLPVVDGPPRPRACPNNQARPAETTDRRTKIQRGGEPATKPTTACQPRDTPRKTQGPGEPGEPVEIEWTAVLRDKP